MFVIGLLSLNETPSISAFQIQSRVVFFLLAHLLLINRARVIGCTDYRFLCHQSQSSLMVMIPVSRNKCTISLTPHIPCNITAVPATLMTSKCVYIFTCDFGNLDIEIAEMIRRNVVD